MRADNALSVSLAASGPVLLGSFKGSRGYGAQQLCLHFWRQILRPFRHRRRQQRRLLWLSLLKLLLQRQRCRWILQRRALRVLLLLPLSDHCLLILGRPSLRRAQLRHQQLGRAEGAANSLCVGLTARDDVSARVRQELRCCLAATATKGCRDRRGRRREVRRDGSGHSTANRASLQLAVSTVLWQPSGWSAAPVLCLSRHDTLGLGFSVCRRRRKQSLRTKPSVP